MGMPGIGRSATRSNKATQAIGWLFLFPEIMDRLNDETETLMPQLNAYLGFDGNCAEAMAYYAEVLGGKIEFMMTNGQSPMAAQMPPESANRVMHARLVIDGQVLMAGDCPVGAPYGGINGVCMTLSYEDNAEAERIFGVLAEGGKITMPFQPTFWAERFGMLVDRFGLAWIINGAPIAMEAPLPT